MKTSLNYLFEVLLPCKLFIAKNLKYSKAECAEMFAISIRYEFFGFSLILKINVQTNICTGSEHCFRHDYFLTILELVIAVNHYHVFFAD